MCKAVIDEIRDQIVASGKFKPDKKGKDGVEPFNVSRFLFVAFGKKEQKKWKRFVDEPENLKLSDALKMAEAINSPFSEIITLAKQRASKEDHVCRLDFLNEEKASA